nr:reverse transcriptase domain-containing protein [Tanacetum cinerariifolium]
MRLEQIKAQNEELAAIKAKRVKMMDEYNHYINFRHNPLLITKFSYRVNNSTREAAMRIRRNNQPLNLKVYEKFILKMLRFSEWIELHALASNRQSKSNDKLLKNLKAKFQWVVTQAGKLGIPPPPQFRAFELLLEEKKRKLNDQKLGEKATNQMEKFFQIFHDLHFDINFADTLLLMPKFASTIKSLLVNKDKLFELAKVPLNENCSAMLLKKLPEKLGDPELTLTRMTLELADRSITHPKGVAEDVFVNVGKFHFLTDFIVVDFEANPIEITLRVNDESITFYLNQTMRYSLTYDDTLVNKVDVIDIACEEFVQYVLDFQYNPKSSSPTLVSNDLISESDVSKVPIVKSSSPTLTPFGESNFFLEEIKDFLNDDSIPTKIENSIYDPEGDILFLEKLLNDDPFQLPLMDLKLAEESKEKSFVDEPPELELKELPSHLEYAFLEDSNKSPVIIAKNLKVDEKEALINVLKSHKHDIAWKIYDIKGIDLRFCTHKILMEDDYKPAVQSKRRVNPKIYDVIKKEVIKLLDAGMIYPISDSPWVSPIHCVPKKVGMTVVANENNELIPTRLVTGWREKTTFTCPYGTFAYRRMPFGLCNAPVFGDSFSSCLTNLDKMLNRCEETNIVLNWEKCHFMCREGIVLGYKISKSGIEVDRAKVDVIAKLPHLTTVKGVRSFLGHAGFYRRFIQDFSKIARLITHLLKKEIPFVFSKEFLGQRKSKHFQPIHYASKTMIEAQIHYTTTKKEMLAVVYAFEKFQPYLVLSKSKVYTDHSALKYLLNKQDAKPRKLLKSSKLAMRDLPGAIMVPISQQRREKYLREMRCLKRVSKFVEAKALPTNDVKVVVKFLKYLFSRFGIPRVIISDHGTHFCNDQFTHVMIKYGVTHRLVTAYHPQTSGQVEVSNCGLKRILERMVGENRTSWSDKLDDALWAFHTAYKTLIGCTPYKLVYGKSCHLLIELEHRAYWALKHVNFDLKTMGDHRKLQLNELSELRDHAYENYIFSGKLKTRWSGPFTITRVFPYGTIELSQPNVLNFKVNGHRVNHYFGGDIPFNVAPDLHTFPMDD